jgi:hypothetical protein
MTKPTDKFLGLRTYTVIPGTVQTPIKITMDGKTRRQIAGRFENTRDIVQPAGRQAQQGQHVRAMLEHHLIFLELNKVLYLKKRIPKHLSTQIAAHAITGITKKCRDSFELIHVKNLLEAANIRYFEFEDTQEDLYENVATALITEPVTPFAVAGILDYLPLWDGK